MDTTALDYSRYFWQGDLVRLRPLCMDDAAAGWIASVDSSARQMLECGVELPTSLALERTTLERYIDCKDADGVIIFAIETHDGRHVGGTSLHSRDQKDGTFGFGIMIQAEYRGHGYTRDASRILLRYGFYEQRYQKCNSACLAGNTESVALHRALGFVEEGLRRRQVFFDGHYHDELLFGLTREESDATLGG